MSIQWDKAPYGIKAYFVDVEGGRWLIQYNKETKCWDVKWNGKLKAEAQNEQSAKDYVSTQIKL